MYTLGHILDEMNHEYGFHGELKLISNDGLNVYMNQINTDFMIEKKSGKLFHKHINEQDYNFNFILFTDYGEINFTENHLKRIEIYRLTNDYEML